MASKSERSFGARLFRGRELHSYVGNFNGFNPPRVDDSPNAIKLLLDNIDQTNGSRAAANQNYGNAVVTRLRAFRNDDLSIFKLLAPIRSAVLANYGKNSSEFDQVVKAVQKIRGTKLISLSNTDGDNEETISKSEQSFGSSTMYFSELVNIVEQFPNYISTTPETSIAGLRTFLNQISDLNTTVFNTYQNLRAIRKLRHRLYNDLAERVTRIKAYTKSFYGTQSDEYNLIKGLKI